MPISDAAKKYAGEVNAELKAHDIRSWLDERNETIGKKIREAEMQKIPYILVIGEKEAAAKAVAVRERGRGDRGQVKLDRFIADVKRSKRE